jgi:hypothetical protein
MPIRFAVERDPAEVGELVASSLNSLRQHSAQCHASTRLAVVVLGGLLPGSVSVIEADSSSIWPLWACPALDLSSLIAGTGLAHRLA